MTLAVLIFDYIGGTLLVYLALRAYPDHSVHALTTWGMLYLFAVVLPVIGAVRDRRWLRARGIDMTTRVRTIIASPLIAGGMTLLAALDLLRRVTH